jgi:hypothetical protein
LFSVGAAPVPNQYSGRYISMLKSAPLLTLMKEELVNGKM